MNKRWIFLLLLCPFFIGCTQRAVQTGSEMVCMQIVDRNGLSETISNKERLNAYETSNFTASQPYSQVIRIYGKNEQGKTKSKLTRYHENGQIYQYLEILEGRANGYFREWHPNGVLHIEALVIGGPAECSLSAQEEWIFDKEGKIWNEKGQLISKISYEKGALQGPSFYYFPDGKLEKVVPYVQNKIDGEVILYNQEQKVKRKEEYKNGKKEGLSIEYSPDGSLLYEELYNNGLLQEGKYYNINPLFKEGTYKELKKKKLLCEIQNGSGKKAFYNPFSRVEKIASFKKGEIFGKVEIFDANGEISSYYHIENGRKNGEEVLFYTKEDTLSKEKLPKLSLHWENDLLSGQVNSFYPNGQIESQRQMTANKKNGTFCGWYLDGNLMFVEEYESDRLVSGSYYKRGQKDPISSVIRGKGIATLFDKEGAFLKRISYDKGEAVQN